MAELQADLVARVRALPCFRNPSDIAPLDGGTTNRNLLVQDGGGRFVVRLGADIPEHGILRWNELAVARAAARAGMSPDIIHAEPGLVVLAHVDARPLAAADRADPACIPRLAALVAAVHRAVSAALTGPVLAFSVPHILRGYAALLAGRASPHAPLLPGLLAEAEMLAQAIGPGAMVLCHNDLLPGNVLVAPDRLWLIDWEYAGLGNPLFDLGGLAGNNGFSPAEERALLEAYHDAPLTDALWRAYAAMKCAALLREAMWNMVSQHTSALPVDYAAGAAANLAAYRAALADFRLL